MPRPRGATTASRAANAHEPKRLPGARYWRRIVPELHVGDPDYLARASQQIQLPPHVLADCKAKLLNDGFFTIPEALPYAELSIEAMRRGVKKLVKRGWPASLLLLYDETWVMAHQLSRLMADVSGGCVNSLDMLAWSVTPALGQAGFAPHRDRQPANVRASFRSDGTAKYTTVWVALSPATPDNSCLYLVPRQHDRGYAEGDDHHPDAEDPLIATLRSDVAVQSVRACPLHPGGAVIFTHRAMHWGSAGQQQCTVPRVSISFGHSDPTFEAPFFRAPARELPFPKISVRAALAAAQLINYHERFDISLQLLRRLGVTYRAHLSRFNAEYAQKTAAEFMAACHDLRAREAGKKGAAAGSKRKASTAGRRTKASRGMELPNGQRRVVDATDNLYDDFDDFA